MSGRSKMRSIRPPSAMANRSASSRTTSSSRSGSAAPARSGTATPASMRASGSASRNRSPNGQVAGVKRKERDFDEDAALLTNINVVVRCRGRNDREVRENSGVVVQSDATVGKTIELSMGPNAISNKRYTFDKVFSPAANQAMVYEEVVAPILDQMLHGFNCTVFAYGQTGTGKTYTMSGDMSDSLGLMSDSAGIIPRVLISLFKTLEADEMSESTVKCSFIELYNEELRDLIALDESTKLKIFDQEKKGHTSTMVQGMEESHIKNADEGIRLLQTGSHRRQVAATKCNDLSSRSHTVFTITVFAKRTSESGDDEVCTGKLNLVDLAGSENIQRSGAENKRATEAGLINKSLLTLGRVINALVDRNSHIPYRESKLTRLLQDSLGGRTKTCIIATVSPSKSNLEETMSTLDYAFRAKNIRNKPQINQLIPKHTLLREFTAEIQQLKSELIMTRQRNGVYLSNENYEELTVQNESRRILSEEQRAKIEIMEASLRNKTQEFVDLTSDFSGLKKDNESVRRALSDARGVLKDTETLLSGTKKSLQNETLLREAHQATEEELSTKSEQLIGTLTRTVKDVKGLSGKVQRQADLHSLNRANWQSSQEDVSTTTRLIEAKVGEFQKTQQGLVNEMSDKIKNFVAQELDGLYSHTKSVESASTKLETLEEELIGQASDARNEMNNVLEEIKTLREDVKSKVGEGLQGLSAAAGKISAGVISELDVFHKQLHSSYTVLGDDLKKTFEALDKQLIAQKNEALRLREELASATDAAHKRNQELGEKFQASMREEKIQASLDRSTLLSQITALVNASGTAQEERWQRQVDQAKVDLDSAHAITTKEIDECQVWLDAWVAKEASLQAEMAESHDQLRSRMKAGWKQADEQHGSISATTRAVHEETVRIVNGQMQDMSVQMASLDDFVTRARSQNETHHMTHLQSLGKLGAEVWSSFEQTTSALGQRSTSVANFQNSAEEQTSAMMAAIPTLDSSAVEPLAQLRETIDGAPITEYSVTGQTPARTQYAFPRTLPRTAAHETLIARGRPLTIEKPCLEAMPASAPASPNKKRSPSKSPSKNNVYSETKGQPLSSLSLSPRKSSDDNTLSLREIDTNILAAAPALAIVSAGAAGGKLSKDDLSDLTVSKRRKAGALADFESHTAPVSIDLSKNVATSGQMGPPPLKKLDREGAKARMGLKKYADGRENQPVEHHGSTRAGGAVRQLRRLRNTARQ